MNTLEHEAIFFHDIAPRIRKLVLGYGGKASIAKHKGIGDYATEVDIAVEDLIVEELQKRFPSDHILAEEKHSDVAIPKGRIWIIDPICGTSNIGRGIKNYCTNIALANNGVLIASCVVDHSQDDYFWSIGDNKLYINDEQFHQLENDDRSVVIDVDFGALTRLKPEQVEKHMKAVNKLLRETEYTIASLNTSLGFAYTAVGKMDGYINSFSHPWDTCASTFLIQQSGGVVTDLSGNPWKISSNQAIAAKNKTIHKKLLDSYSRSS